MLLLLAVLLLIGWVMGFAVFHVTAFAIHILIIAAVIAFVLHFVRGAGSKG